MQPIKLVCEQRRRQARHECVMRLLICPMHIIYCCEKYGISMHCSTRQWAQLLISHQLLFCVSACIYVAASCVLAIINMQQREIE